MKFSARTLKAVTSLALMGSVALTACAAPSVSSTSGAVSGGTASSVATSGAVDSSVSTVVQGGAISYDTHFDADDLLWDEGSEVSIDLSNPVATEGVSVDEGLITISAAGNYRLSGSYEGQVKVAAGAEDVVRLILDNASVSNESGTALYSESANETVIYTVAGTTNTIEDGATYSATGEEDPAGAIDAKTDLTLAGEGVLKVIGRYQDAIATGDGLTIVSGTYEVEAADDGVRGKDYVDILGGTVSVQAVQDGIKSTNTDDAERGWVRLSGGEVSIAAGDDGFKAERELEVTGGTLTITESTEGIEGQYLIFNGGTISVTSSDDSLNATAPDTSTTTSSTDASQAQSARDQAPGGMGGGMDAVEDASITVNAGSITLNTNGDGFDSNGTATVNGGTLVINGPFTGGNGSVDVNGNYTLNGGTVLTGGTADMFVAPSSEAQGYVVVSASGLAAGETVTLKNQAGDELATYTVTNSQTQVITFSTAEVVSGETYTVSLAGEETEVTAQ